MKLIIAEKKELALAIADAIPGQLTKQGQAICKGEYTIVWCSGHLLALKEPEDYSKEYEEWNLEQLPIYFPNWEMKIGKSVAAGTNKSDRVRFIGQALKSANLVIHAGDCDDEGQLIVDEILRWHNYTGPVKRLNTSDTTAPMLRKALASMQDNTLALQREGWAAYARSVSDAIVGFNLTRAMSTVNHTILPVGRVQTPTLGLVVNRDKQIEGHKKLTYYTVETKVSMAGIEVPAEYIPAENNINLVDGRILDIRFAKSIAGFLEGLSLTDIKVEKKEVSEAPPLPFNLTKLTTYCSTHFGFDNVMEITQSLRDKYKAITYNRTDCQYLGDEHFAQAPGTVAQVLKNTGISPNGIDTSIRSKCFDQSKISVHFAIIPTAESVDLSKMTKEERLVYEAIAKRYLMQFLPPAKKMRTTMTVPLSDGGSIRASSTEIISPGFLMLAGKDGDNDNRTPLSGLSAGTYAGKSHDAKVVEKETKPPARYTIASLAEDMSRIAKYVTDPEAKKLLLAKDKDRTGENGSIGTTATREAIIRSLIKRGLLIEDKKHLISTDKGRELYRAMPDEFRLADTTAKWWAIQEDIKNGTAKPDDLILIVLESVKHFLSGTIPTVSFTNQTSTIIGNCPACGRPVRETAKGFVCAGFNPDDEKACKFFVAKKNPNFPPLAGKTITPATMKKLISGQSVLVKNIKKKDGSGTYNADLSLVIENGRAKWNLTLPQFEIVGTCPICGQPVKETSNGFMCSGFVHDNPNSCRFYVAKKNENFSPLANKTLSTSDMKKLLSGQAITIKGIKKKDGSGTYSADLSLFVEDNHPRWKLSMPERKVLGACPVCGGDVVEGRTGYGCMNFRKDPPCRFYIAREQKFPPLAKHKITATDVKKLLSGKAISVKGIPKKSGTGTYDANFKIKWDGQYVNWDMSFPEKKNK